MRLWSIRSLEEFNTLQSGISVRADPARVDPDFLPAYRWMAAALERHVAPPPGVELPVWLWKQWQGPSRARPDLRSRGHLPRGTQAIRLELEIPEERLLISDFDRWHAVLNRAFNSYGAEDDDALAAIEAAHGPGHEAAAAFREQSWQKIFDLSLIDDPANWPLQAVTWELRPQDVRGFTRFTAR